jgi:pyrroline-5-carboxylate reductase
MTTTPVIAIIGAGNMGSSLIGGLIKNGHPSNKLWATDASQEKLDHLQPFHIHTTADNIKAVQAADVIILALKPQILADVAKALSQVIVAQQPLVISIAAGIRETNLQHWLSTHSPTTHLAIVRAMPNTPALIGCGATALYANAYVTAQQRNIAESILRAVGIVVWVKHEELIDTVTALSGSGPAYFFLMMEALQQAAEQLGLPAEQARLLTLQTALGAARMAMESGKSVAELRQNVTSPGGTTERALAVLEQKEIRALFKSALEAAQQRSIELAELLGEKK